MLMTFSLCVCFTGGGGNGRREFWVDPYPPAEDIPSNIDEYEAEDYEDEDQEDYGDTVHT